MTTTPPRDLERLAREHATLIAEHARAQARCSAHLAAQAGEIERLRAEAVRLRGALIARDSALAFERQDRAQLQRMLQSLPRRAANARSVLCVAQDDTGQPRARRVDLHGGGELLAPTHQRPDPALLEASLVAADLVICQTGCLSHEVGWRVQDHCRRTGKPCVMVDKPPAIAWLRAL